MTKSQSSERFVKTVYESLTAMLFRARVFGSEHVPSSGPALLVSNHVTHFDAFLIGSCLRPGVRFLVWKTFYDHWIFHWGLSLGNAIPISDSPRDARRAINLARQAIKRGELVCIFGEGGITRNGELQEFKRGIELICRGLDIPIIPVHLGDLWDSIYSFKGGRVLLKWPKRLRQPVTITFGEPMPGHSTAEDVRARIESIGAANGVSLSSSSAA